MRHFAFVVVVFVCVCSSASFSLLSHHHHPSRHMTRSIPQVALFALVVLCILQLGSAVDKNQFNMQKNTDANKEYKRAGAEYLQMKSQKPGVITLKSGMLVEIINTSAIPDCKSPHAEGKPTLIHDTRSYTTLIALRLFSISPILVHVNILCCRQMQGVLHWSIE
jgi:hypothetical protein